MTSESGVSSEILRTNRLDTWRHGVERWGRGLGVECDRDDLCGQVLKADLAGATLWSISSGQQLMRRTRTAPGFAFGPTAIIQISGETLIRQAGRACEIGPGSFAFIDIASPHEVEYTNDFKVLALQFPVNTFQRGAFAQASVRALSSDVPQNAPFYQCAVNLFQIAGTIHPLRHASALTALVALSHITTAIVEAETEVPQPVRMVRAMQYIEQNLGDPDLTAQRVADAQGVSRRYLDTLFGTHGHRVQTWIWERRLLRAAEDLRLNTQWRHTILQAALDHGFKTPSHFSRAFTKRFGMPPREYRKENAVARLNS
jgi:AraC-like DNA-binding protein